MLTPRTWRLVPVVLVLSVSPLDGGPRPASRSVQADRADATAALDARLARYESGDLSVVDEISVLAADERLRTLFTRAADAWIASAPAPALSRRLAAATLALEIVHRRLGYDQIRTVVGYIEWGERQLAAAPTAGRDCVWAAAASAILARLNTGDFEDTFARRARRRCPDDDRLALAELLAVPTTPPTIIRREHSEREWRRLEAEINTRGLVAPYLALRRLRNVRDSSRHDVVFAYTRLALQESTDTGSHYIAHLIAAWSFEKEGRLQDAIREYRDALVVQPSGQTATLGLAHALILTGATSDARDLLQRSMGPEFEREDPWQLYSFGLYRFWPQLIADTRRQIR